MDIMGLCHICGRPGAMFTCIFCGKIICGNCYDKTSGICINCKAGLK